MRHKIKGEARPGTLRAERLQSEKVARGGWVQRLKARLVRESTEPRRFNPTGLKRQYVFGEGEDYILTPYYAKEIRRRRKRSRIAHESRRRNFQS